jgi:hypothetical protein
MVEDSVMAITKEIDVDAFRAGLFMWKANVLSPIEIQFPPRVSSMRLEEACDNLNTLNNGFFPWTIQGGIGLYSLVQGPAGLLTRLDTLMRNATKSEMERDWQYFGEQVMGPEVGNDKTGEYKNNPTFKALDSEFYYIGPPRLVGARFATRVFPGNMPEEGKLSEIVKQVDELGLEQGQTPKGKVFFQGYQLFHADKGRIYVNGFREFEDYDSDETEFFGNIEVFKRGHFPGLRFYPRGDREKEKDFSSVIDEKLSNEVLTKLQKIAK